MTPIHFLETKTIIHFLETKTIIHKHGLLEKNVVSKYSHLIYFHKH